MINGQQLKRFFASRKQSTDRTGFRAFKPKPWGGGRLEGGDVQPDDEYSVDENNLPETYVGDNGEVIPLDSKGTFSPPVPGTVIPNPLSNVRADQMFPPSNDGDGNDDENGKYVDQMNSQGTAPTSAGMPASPTSGDVPDGSQPAIDPRMVGRQPYRRSNLDDAVNTNQQALIDAIQAPDKKASKWATAGIVAAELANNVFNPRNPVKVQGWGAVQHDKSVQKALEALTPLQQQQEIANKVDLGRAQSNWIKARPGIEQGKADISQQRADTYAERTANEGQYRRELVSLGKDKADNLKDYRDAIVDLKERGADQSDARIKALQDRITEITRHNKVTEGQGGQKIQISQNTLKQKQSQFDQQLTQKIQQQKQAGTYKRASITAGLDAALKAGTVTKDEYDRIMSQLPPE